MDIIRTPEEFLEIWYYKSYPPKKSQYPKRYPCIVELITQGGGLGGEYEHHEITYIPDGMDPKTFMAGYKAGRNVQD